MGNAKYAQCIAVQPSPPSRRPPPPPQVWQEAVTQAHGGIPGINHLAHLAGALTGAVLISGMARLSGPEPQTPAPQ